MTETLRTTRTEVHRLPVRGAYDRKTMHAILDEGLICHVGFVFEGSPFVIPTGYGRDGDQLLIHGSAASRMLRALSAGTEACITVTLLDGLVLARSAFHHSMNYRSVVVLARGTLIDEPEEKMAALRLITERLVPGRWDGVRQPTPQEMKATTALSFPINEASAKVRTGPPRMTRKTTPCPSGQACCRFRWYLAHRWLTKEICRKLSSRTMFAITSDS
jgi:nitroimidazol reductase NimA-like FMN-containing flavoprotein (pyridoxamine 5'-phosphate oxidase superfamily)